MEGSANESAEWFLSSHSSDIGDMFGDPEILPRVGDQYQVEIPPLMTEYDRLQLITMPSDAVLAVDVPKSFILGLPVAIMWTHVEAENSKDKTLNVHANQDNAVDMNGSIESENSEESQITSNNEDAELKVEPLGTALDDGEEVGGLSNPQPTVAGEMMDVDFVLPQEKRTKLGHRDSGYDLVPGLPFDSWREIEYDSFLLGLYIFGKNLLLVKRLVESKEMRDVLSYYYGKFYRSAEYYRWSECRKMRSRRCIHGQKIFTGWRQQELLLRLFSHVSEECKNMLMEVSRTFGDGKISLEGYVFTLKHTVGINMLIEAVGIGKGKQDLTCTALEPIKNNPSFPSRPEIPIGKACSSLTSNEIINFLTGDFRLSKARSNDLFWEAVWPRLLARGWYSEQPRDHTCAGSKHSLVFLTPDVKKFSRRRLVKGNHYFDSVSDVLNKVASEPGLLELEIEGANASTHKEGYKSDTPIKQDPDVLSNQQRHCYLQPRNSNCNRDSIKFTIVDTSLVYGDEQKVRELRSLPADPMNLSTPSGLSSEGEHDTSEESQHIAEENYISKPVDVVAESGAFADSPECATSIPKSCLPNGPDPMIVRGKDHEDQSTGISDERESKVRMQFQSSQKVKSYQSKYLAPVTKQHQLTAWSHEESSHAVEKISRDTKLNEEESPCWSNSPDMCENVAFQVGSHRNLSSFNSMTKCSPDESNEGILNGNCLCAEASPEEPHPQTSIDLNLPHVPSDAGHREPFIMNVVHKNDDSSDNKPSLLSETSQQLDPLNPSDGGVSMEQKPVANGRRQSTRNRPLTMRALEALECGFLGTTRKRKRVEAQSQNDLMSTSSRRMRGKTATGRTLNGRVGDSKTEEGLHEVSSGNTDMVGESQK